MRIFLKFILITLSFFCLKNNVNIGADLPPIPTINLSEPPIEPAEPETPKYVFQIPTIENGSLVPAETTAQVSSVLQILGLLTFITLAPSFLILMTGFTRIIIVLSFIRRALGTQTLPPDQVMVGLALFLTLFVMAPTWKESWDKGISPYLNGHIMSTTGNPMTQSEMFEAAMDPQRNFMWHCLRANDARDEVQFFLSVSGSHHVDDDGRRYWIGADNRRIDNPDYIELRDVPTTVLIPAYISAELKKGFWMGFFIYVPFLILDMVIASILMAMGMMMLPPVMISLPFKVVLFILVDGWQLVMEGLVMSFPAGVLQYSPLYTVPLG